MSFLTVLAPFRVLTCFVTKFLIIYKNVPDMTHTAHAYVTNVNILELPCASACAYACAYLTSGNQAL